MFRAKESGFRIQHFGPQPCIFDFFAVVIGCRVFSMGVGLCIFDFASGVWAWQQKQLTPSSFQSSVHNPHYDLKLKLPNP